MIMESWATVLGLFILVGVGTFIAYKKNMFIEEEKKVKAKECKIPEGFIEPEQFSNETKTQYIKRKMRYKNAYDIKQLEERINNTNSKLEKDRLNQKLNVLLEQKQLLGA